MEYATTVDAYVAAAVADADVPSTVADEIANHELPVAEACRTQAAVTIDVPVVCASTVIEYGPRAPGMLLPVAVVTAVARWMSAARTVSWLMIAPC